MRNPGRWYLLLPVIAFLLLIAIWSARTRLAETAVSTAMSDANLTETAIRFDILDTTIVLRIQLAESAQVVTQEIDLGFQNAWITGKPHFCQAVFQQLKRFIGLGLILTTLLLDIIYL